jgi:TolB protein
MRRSGVTSLIITLGLIVAFSSHTDPARAASDPRNGRIAFSSYREGQVDIYTMGPDGGGVRNLTNDTAPDFQPAWSTDGERIAFVSLHVGSSHFDQLYTMDPDGGDRTRLTDLGDGNVEEPAWSPDGERIAFYVTYGGAIDDELFTVGADGSEPVRLTDNARSDSDPAWSPDGTRLAFVRDGRLLTMDPDGTDVRHLTPKGVVGFDPSWSPDGRHLAFIGHTASSSRYDLFTISADGTDLVQLADTKRTETNPSWSPDGRRIVYVLTRHHEENDFDEDLICTIRSAGGGRRVLSADATVSDGFPDWGPRLP